MGCIIDACLFRTTIVDGQQTGLSVDSKMVSVVSRVSTKEIVLGYWCRVLSGPYASGVILTSYLHTNILDESDDGSPTSSKT